MKQSLKIFAAACLIVACVPQRKMDDLQAKYDVCQKSNSECSTQLSGATANLLICNDNNSVLKTRMLGLQADSLECFTAFDRTKKLHEQSEETAQRIIENNRYENGRLTTDLNAKNEALKNKERVVPLLTATM